MIRFLFPFLLLLGCGGQNGLNPNAAWVTDEDKARVDVLLARSKIEFDRNNLGKSEYYANKAYKQNTNNQEAAQQLGNIYIGKAHLALLDIASRISTDLNTGESGASNTQALDVLGILADVAELTQAEYQGMGTLRTSTVTYNNAQVEIPAFDNLDVIVPFTPGSYTDKNSMRYKVSRLRMINQTIGVLCPFIEKSVFNGVSDPRYNCRKVKDSTANVHGQVLFTFAIAHLLEAIFFNAVLQYSNNVSSSTTGTVAAESSNLFKRAQAMQNTRFTVNNSSVYAAGMIELVYDINNTFSSASDSMLAETLIDLKVTSQALGAIKGFPQGLRSKIEDTQTTIQKAIAKVGQSQSNVSNQIKALKDQFSAAAISKMNTAITAFNTNNPSASAQIKDVCNAYKTLTESLLNEANAPTPTGC